MLKRENIQVQFENLLVTAAVTVTSRERKGLYRHNPDTLESRGPPEKGNYRITRRYSPETFSFKYLSWDLIWGLLRFVSRRFRILSLLLSVLKS